MTTRNKHITGKPSPQTSRSQLMDAPPSLPRKLSDHILFLVSLHHLRLYLARVERQRSRRIIAGTRGQPMPRFSFSFAGQWCVVGKKSTEGGIQCEKTTPPSPSVIAKHLRICRPGSQRCNTLPKKYQKSCSLETSESTRYENA